MKQIHVVGMILLGVLIYVSGAFYGMIYGQKAFDNATATALFFIVVGSMIFGAGIGISFVDEREE